DLFAQPCAHGLGEELPHVGKHGQHLQLLQEAFGGLHVEQLADALGDLVQLRHLERHLHPPLGAELIDQYRNAIATLDVLEQQSRTPGKSVTPGCALGDAVGYLSDLQDWVDLGGGALELPGALQRVNPFSQIVVSHLLLRHRISTELPIISDGSQKRRQEAIGSSRMPSTRSGIGLPTCWRELSS